MSKKTRAAQGSNSSGRKSSRIPDSSKEDVPVFLYNGIPTSLRSSDLSTTLHNSLKIENSGSPYPVIDSARKSSGTSTKSSSNKALSPNLKVNTSIEDDEQSALYTTPNKSRNSRRAMESLDISKDESYNSVPIHSTPKDHSAVRNPNSDPFQRPPHHQSHSNQNSLSKFRLAERRTTSAQGDPYVNPRMKYAEDTSTTSADNVEYHSAYGSMSELKNSSISESEDFSYEKTNLTNFDPILPPADADNDFHFHQKRSSNSSAEIVRNRKSVDAGDLLEATVSTPASRGKTHTPTGSAGNSLMFVSPAAASRESSHSHNSSVNSQSSFGSRKINRGKVRQSPHSRQSSLSWPVNDPEEWTLERVVYWLTLHGFNKSWIDVFTQNNLTGSKFLSLANYNNISKYIEYLSFASDSTPSRFIHLLRKTLDKPSSDTTVRLSPSVSEAFSRRKSQFNEDNAQEDEERSVISSSDMTSVSPSPVVSIDAEISGNHNREAEESPSLAELVPTLSAPNLSTTAMRKSPLSKNSVESLATTIQRPLKKGTSSRPFSTIENSTYGSAQPSSPVSFSQGFFKRHSKSNSSESSLFSSIFTGTVNSSYTTEGDLSSKKSAKLDSPTTDAKKSIMSKLRNKVSDRNKSVEAKSRHNSSKAAHSPVSTVSSPVEQNPLSRIPEARREHNVSPKNTDRFIPAETRDDSIDNLSMLKFVLDRKYQPKSMKTNSDLFILVTRDNESFIPCNIGSVSNLAELKIKIMKDLHFETTDSMVFHLTDFGSEEGEALDDDTLDKLRSFQFYGGASKVLVRENVRTRSDSTSISLSASSTRSSFAQSLENVGEGTTYPATPQYLLENANQSKDPVDYLNFKESYAQARRKSSLVSGKPLQSIPSISADDRGGFSSQSSLAGTVSSTTRAHIKAINDSNTFRVIRKESVGEIDFDKRRDSPFQKSQIIARRNPPPPPATASAENLSRSGSALTRNKSIKKRKPHNTTPAESASSTKSSSLMVTSTDDDSATYLSPFTPGLSHTLVPQPYRGSVSPVSRTPVSAPGDSHFSEDEDEVFKVRNIPDLSKSENSTTHRAMRRDDSIKSFATVPDKDRFKENFISFEGAPSLSGDDDSGDSDDDLWAKAPSKANSFNSTQEYKVNDLDTIQAESTAKMTVRPPAEVVYDNLERFFPNTDLDRPIVDETTSPLMSPLVETSPVVQKIPPLSSNTVEEKKTGSISRKVSNADTDKLKVENRGGFAGNRRMKTIRVVAREANEARKRLSENANNSKKSNLLRRTSTKMWGQKVVEVTPSQLQGGYVSKLKNHKGEYKQFAWVKGELIGKGTFGKVYLALNVTTGEMMAVKQVNIPSSGVANQQVTEVIEALLSEVETMKDLDHINIVQYLGFEKVGNIYSLFLEYVAGGSVGSCLRMYGRFEEDLIRYLTAQVLKGLAYLHSRGILHRDLKADNLLLEIDGSCKISDFGISKRSQNIYANDAEMSMQGTIFWMAPEVIDNVVHNKKQGYSAKIDIWSLGCVVLEMFAGRRPWSNVEAIGAIYKLGKTKLAPPIPEDTLPHVSSEGKDFIERCFTIDPEKRPTAQELLKHPFCQVNTQFEFSTTKLAKAIKFNEKSREKVLRLGEGRKKKAAMQ